MTEFSEVLGIRRRALRDRLLPSESPRPLTFNPGDSIVIVGWKEVPPETVLCVKIALLGLASTALTTEQWTAGAVSAPEKTALGAPMQAAV